MLSLLISMAAGAVATLLLLLTPLHYAFAVILGTLVFAGVYRWSCARSCSRSMLLSRSPRKTWPPTASRRRCG